MSTRSASYAAAIEHLPVGATLVIPGITWEEYERLLDELGDRPGVHLSYDEGTLHVMSPSAEHEAYKELILRAAQTLAEELDLALETRGSTTWKKRAVQKGVERDTCFYVANAHRIIGRRTLDLDRDPPPDVAVEIDTTNESLSKFPIYSALGIPEIWRYDGRQARFYALVSGTYAECAASRFFPAFTATLLTELLGTSKTAGQMQAIRALRDRLRARRD
jgi:Uma2 family endonuclease